MKAEDIEMQADFFAHYGSAPVTAWVIRDDLENDLQSVIGTGNKVIKFNGSD